MINPSEVPVSAKLGSNPNPEDEVSRKADRLVEEAGEAMVEATKGMTLPVMEAEEVRASTKTVVKGREVRASVENLPTEGPRKGVSISRRPSFFNRLFRRGRDVQYGDVDEHDIGVAKDGSTSYTTVRPSVLGGHVRKNAYISTGEDGTKNVSFEITRYDADGDEVTRERPESSVFDTFASQTSSRQVESARAREKEVDEEKDPERREELRNKDRELRERRAAKTKVVVDTSSAIAEEVQRAMKGGKSDLSTKPGIDRNGRSVPQVPKGASKYAEGYQARRRAERKVLEEDPDSIEHAAKGWGL